MEKLSTIRKITFKQKIVLGSWDVSLFLLSQATPFTMILIIESRWIPSPNISGILKRR